MLIVNFNEIMVKRLLLLVLRLQTLQSSFLILAAEEFRVGLLLKLLPVVSFNQRPCLLLKVQIQCHYIPTVATAPNHLA